MTLRRVLLVSACLALGAAVLVQARRLGAVTADLYAAEAALVALTRDAQEIADLRARPERLAQVERPTQDTLARLTAALAEAGLPSVRLRDLTRDSDGMPAPAGARRQSLRFTLEPVTIPQLGSFLEQWRSSQQLWTMSRIELAHSGAPEHPTFTARFVISALVAEPRQPAPIRGVGP